mmetsp:Transcript_37508/g.79557  ORF Transcript_37508/g.79557 Transcript_37508/m.79557 type:complete len:100 (-) Transcript_37508:117-416(-)
MSTDGERDETTRYQCSKTSPSCSKAPLCESSTHVILVLLQSSNPHALYSPHDATFYRRSHNIRMFHHLLGELERVKALTPCKLSSLFGLYMSMDPSQTA